MAELPSRVKIGPWIYTVERNAKKLQESERADRKGYAGVTKHDQCSIVLNEDEPEQRVRETLWHEIKHAVCNLFSCSDTAKMAEESWIAATAPLELMVMRDNPDLLAYLMAED